MDIKVKERLFERMEFYLMVHDKADSNKVADPAYNEILITFYELAVKFDSIDFLKKKITTQINTKYQLTLATFMLMYDRSFALEIIKSVANMKEKMETEVISANHILREEYNSIDSLIENLKMTFSEHIGQSFKL